MHLKYTPKVEIFLFLLKTIPISKQRINKTENRGNISLYKNKESPREYGR